MENCGYYPTEEVFTVKVNEIMSQCVVKIHPEETVEVAARTLKQHNIGFLPVCNTDGKLCGLLTDRDLITRCVAANLNPATTSVRQVMTGRVLSVSPDMEASAAAHLMGREQIRRLPVVDNGNLCGVLSLGDLSRREESVMDAADAMSEITENYRLG
jgi:CBS domain-containing protein